MLDGMAGDEVIKIMFLQIGLLFPQGFEALTQINPPLNLVLNLTVIHEPLFAPTAETPSGNDQI